jgi:hypothetical protein
VKYANNIDDWSSFSGGIEEGCLPLRENKNSFFYVSFDLAAYVGLPLGRMSGCCSVKRGITQIG